jgi:FAD/FMN-containing dehydrogenase/uncharacterized membrane protein YhaH (DUF805 family)
MNIKEKLPVSYLLFTSRGRISRLTYLTVSVFIWTAFYILFNALSYFVSYTSTLVVYPLLFWALTTTAIKRMHDCNRSGYWLALFFIPFFGVLILIIFMLFKRGNLSSNRYGAAPGSAPDYYKNRDAEMIPHLRTEQRIVNDVTQLNPIIVAKVETPDKVEELQECIRNSTRPICIGGGRFSMGGQTASPNSIHIDMRRLNRILEFSAENKTIKVQAGARWCDIQHYIDPYNLSIKIMQTYANFTVGGSLSVNVHGRYIGMGPVILSVKSIEVILANGDIVQASPLKNSAIFFACVGCYNAIGVIVTAEFELTDNVAVERIYKTMKRKEYNTFFRDKVRENKDVVFHNGDIYPPLYVRAVSWVKTKKQPTVKTRLMPIAAAYPLERYFIGAFSKSKFGKWRREHIIDPLLYLKTKVHWRNYEAGYDVAELEPGSRKNSTYVLQEYFVPVKKFDDFSVSMAEIFQRHKVNVINVSIRHAFKDSGSLMAWAKEEVFAFVVWHKQNTHEIEKNKVAVWTRELIEAAISMEGSYYIPYQVHATAEQFHKAFPNAKKLMEMKDEYDPDFKFRNVIWDTYYKPSKK